MKGWFKLLISVLAIYGFVIWMPKLLGKIEMYQKIQESSESRGIENNTIFYSDEPLSYKAEEDIRRKLMF